MKDEELIFLAKNLLVLTESNTITWTKIKDFNFKCDHLGINIDIYYNGNKNQITLTLTENISLLYNGIFSNPENKSLFLELYYTYCAARNQWNKRFPV